MVKLDIMLRCYLLVSKTKIVKIPDKMEITNDSSDKVFVFENYDEYYNFFKKHILTVNKYIIDGAIYKTGRKGQIVAFKRLCEEIIIKQKTDEYYHNLTPDKIKKIHKKGKLTAYDKAREWESLNLCAPGDHVGSASPRCRFFKHDCTKCLLEYASHQVEYDPIDFKLVNSDINNKVKKIER